MVQREFEEFFAKVDTNNDGKIDRWELYDYCLKNITPEWLCQQIDLNHLKNEEGMEGENEEWDRGKRKGEFGDFFGGWVIDIEPVWDFKEDLWHWFPD